MSIEPLYCQPKTCARVNGKQSKLFHMGVGLRQGCVLSLLLSINYLNWIAKLNRTDDVRHDRKVRDQSVAFPRC